MWSPEEPDPELGLGLAMDKDKKQLVDLTASAILLLIMQLYADDQRSYGENWSPNRCQKVRVLCVSVHL